MGKRTVLYLICTTFCAGVAQRARYYAGCNMLRWMRAYISMLVLLAFLTLYGPGARAGSVGSPRFGVHGALFGLFFRVQPSFPVWMGRVGRQVPIPGLAGPRWVGVPQGFVYP